MQLQLDTSSANSAAGDWLILGVPDEGDFNGALATVNDALEGRLSKLRESQDLTGKAGEIVTLLDVPNLTARRLCLIGLGKLDELDEAALQRAMTTAARSISTRKVGRVAAVVPTGGPSGYSLEQRVTTVATALQVGCVGQDLYRAEKKRYPFDEVALVVPADVPQPPLQAALEQGTILGEAINLARELVNLPAKDIYPESFARRAQELAGQYGLHCEVLDQPALAAEKMGSLLAVAEGSDRPPRLVFLEYKGGNGPVLGLIGKGVTFDSGGLSIKPSDSMTTMKCDMAGAATVLATMIAIARLKLPVHVVAAMGLVENMLGGSAMKLGDVLTARNGTTIEVLNTDAEGRLVLADVLDYSIGRGAEYLIDLATLTGACVVALGEDVVGVMTNNQPWADTVLKAAATAGEDVWQLPMFRQYAKLIESDVADIKNVGGRWGGAITAAKFLERFVREKPWVHLDIAGPAFASSDKPHREGGATGCMVRTLIETVRAFPAVSGG